MQRTVLFLALLLFTSPLFAHSLGESYGVVRAASAERSFTVTYNMRRDQFLQLADLRGFAGQAPLDVVAEVVRERYQLSSAGAACEKYRFAAMETESFLQASFVASCPGEASVELNNDAFFDLLPDHLHFLRVSTAEGAFIGERVLDRASRRWELPQAASSRPTDVVLRYAGLGVGHMAFGFDHLAFLASIMLLVRGARPLLYAITGFTVGHSISLALAVLGLAAADGPLVEALIGLTIALVAAESVLRRQGRLGTYAAVILASGGALLLFSALRVGPDPLTLASVTVFFASYLLLTRERPDWLPVLTPLLTVFFGLIHGFGFAGSLLQIGLPMQQLALALLAFNVGIELGQLLMVGVLLALLAALARLAPALLSARVTASNLLASALLALGTFWFVDRAFV